MPDSSFLLAGFPPGIEWMSQVTVTCATGPCAACKAYSAHALTEALLHFETVLKGTVLFSQSFFLVSAETGKR